MRSEPDQRYGHSTQQPLFGVLWQEVDVRDAALVPGEGLREEQHNPDDGGGDVLGEGECVLQARVLPDKHPLPQEAVAVQPCSHVNQAHEARRRLVVSQRVVTAHRDRKVDRGLRDL